MAHSITICHIYVLFINSVICKCDMALEWHFCIISQGVALAGNQNIVDISFIAHIKDIAHIYVLHMNSPISKFQMALKTSLLVPKL